MDPLNNYLATIDSSLHDHIRALDALIRAAAPDLTPSIKWGNLTYHLEANVCALVAHTQYVNLQIWVGATIADPNKLLTGTGKQMRHIKLPVETPYNAQAVTAIVRAAVKAARA
jgi:hypothetical protein